MVAVARERSGDAGHSLRAGQATSAAAARASERVIMSQTVPPFGRHVAGDLLFAGPSRPARRAVFSTRSAQSSVARAPWMACGAARTIGTVMCRFDN